MRIVEAVRTVNGDKTILGKKEIEITLDTETGHAEFSTPAMFGDPVVAFTDLRAAVDKLEALYLKE